MREKVKTSTGLIIIFAAAVVIFGGAYTWANLNPPVEVGDAIFSTVDSAASQTAGWKTYTNSDLGFSFKYPNTWKDVVLTKLDNTNENYGGKYLASTDGKNGITYFDPDNAFDFSAYSNSYKAYSLSVLNKMKINPNWNANQFITNMGLSVEANRILFVKKMNNKSVLLGQYLNDECSPNFRLSVVTPLNSQYPNLEITIAAVNNETDSTVLSYLNQSKSDSSDVCDLLVPYQSVAKKIQDNTYSKKLTDQIRIAGLIANSLDVTTTPLE